MEKSNVAIVAIAWAIGGVLIGGLLGFAGGAMLFGSDAIKTFVDDMNSYSEYFDVKVMEFERRENGIYVKFQNTGTRVVDDMYFEIEEIDANGKLIAEYEGNYMRQVGPGSVEETILNPTDQNGNPAQISGDVKVSYSYGWVTTPSAQ